MANALLDHLRLKADFKPIAKSKKYGLAKMLLLPNICFHTALAEWYFYRDVRVWSGVVASSINWRPEFEHAWCIDFEGHFLETIYNMKEASDRDTIYKSLSYRGMDVTDYLTEENALEFLNPCNEQGKANMRIKRANILKGLE
jgi:hypothetical protein